MGHARKHPYHPHGGNRKLTPLINRGVKKVLTQRKGEVKSYNHK